jgi:hypothetical protein
MCVDKQCAIQEQIETSVFQFIRWLNISFKILTRKNSILGQTKVRCWKVMFQMLDDFYNIYMFSENVARCSENEWAL